MSQLDNLENPAALMPIYNAASGEVGVGSYTAYTAPSPTLTSKFMSKALFRNAPWALKFKAGCLNLRTRSHSPNPNLPNLSLGTHQSHMQGTYIYRITNVDTWSMLRGRH